MLDRALLAFTVAFAAWAPAWAADRSDGPLRSSVSQVQLDGVLEMAPGSADILKVTRGVRTIIIGNPGIVDASVIDESTVAMTAKATGTTNMILLDAQHAEILRTTVQVGARPKQVQVLSGERVRAYACTPSCRLDPKAILPLTEAAATTVVRNPDGTEVSVESGTTRASSPSGEAGTNAPPAQPQ